MLSLTSPNRSLVGCVLSGLLLCSTAAAQPSVSLDLTAHVDSIIAGMPSGNGTNTYQAPSSSQQSEWRTMIDLLMAGDLAQAGAKATPLGYRLIRITDTGTIPSRDYLVVERSPGGPNYWGTYVFAVSPLRPRLIIQSPHPLYDSRTGAQGWHVFITTAARVFFISGAHRCNSSLFTPCDGWTTSCGSDYEPHRRSDQPHVVDGMFQITTAALLAAVDSCVFIQPHGFAKQSTDPDIIMSNGTRIVPPPGQDHLARLRDNLRAVDPTLTFKVAHIDTAWTRLIATTNTQGRLINGSPSPCNVEASSSTGRFLHLEQKYSGLRDTKQNWGKLAQAVALTFPVAPTTVAETTPSGFALSQNYPNPFNPATTIQYSVGASASGAAPTRVRLVIYDVLGRESAVVADGIRPAGTYTASWEAAGFPTGVYVCRLTAGESTASIRMLLIR